MMMIDLIGLMRLIGESEMMLGWDWNDDSLIFVIG